MVGVKELKARLSEYLRAVKRGEVVIVTERDQVIAELRRPSRERDPDATLRERLAALAATGDVSPPRRRRRGFRWTSRGLRLPRGTAARILDELRSD